MDDHLRVLAPPRQQADGHVWADGESGPGPQHMADVSVGAGRGEGVGEALSLPPSLLQRQPPLPRAAPALMGTDAAQRGSHYKG